MSVNLIANKIFSYNGRALKKGDKFVATERDGRVFIAIGRARADDTKEEKPQAYRTRMMTAGASAVSVIVEEPIPTLTDEVTEVAAEEVKAPARRQYTRRTPVAAVEQGESET